jgi:predicted alpha-1,6-mannanase (GH76 family)
MAPPPTPGPTTLASWTTLLLSCALGVACSSASPGQPSPSAFTEQASYSIGEAGGVVLTANGSGVSVPRGALTHDVTLTIESDSSAPVPANVTTVGLTYLLGPEGQPFGAPVTVTLAFDPTEVPAGETASDIVVFTAPRDDTSDYAPLATKVVDGMHVSVETSHFSYFVPAIVKKDADDALSDMLEHFWSGTRRGAHGDLIAGSGEFKATGYWTNAQGLDALLDGVESTKGKRFADFIPFVVKGNGKQFGTRGDSDGWLEPNYGQVYFDDIAWMALALIRAHDDALTYHLPGANSYLEIAAQLIDYTIDHGQSTSGDGAFAGLWWNTRHNNDPKPGTPSIPLKASVANFGSALAAARLSERRSKLTDRDIEDGGLHDLRDAATYASFAVKVYDYWYKNMVETSCAFTGAWVFDNLQLKSVDGKEVWIKPPTNLTYNQGIGIGAALAVAAVDAPDQKDAHLAQARAMADYLVMYETEDGVLHDNTAKFEDGGLHGCTGNCEGFKGIAYRYLMALYRETGVTKYYEVLQASEAAIFAKAFDAPRGLFATDWNEPARSQPNFSHGHPINYGGELNLGANASAAMAAEIFANPTVQRSPTAPWEPSGGSCETPPPPPPPTDGGGGSCGASTGGCHMNSSTAGVCDFNWSTLTGFTCSDDPGYSPGSCSTTNLYGCCVTTTVSPTSPTTTVTTTQAICYYDASLGVAAQANCSGRSGGVTNAWSTCPP